MSIDEKSFHQGLVLGLNTAIGIVRDNPLAAYAELENVRDELLESMNRLYPSLHQRKMVAGDIMLSMPMMIAADLGFHETERPA